MFGVPMLGDTVTLTHQWKTVSVNGHVFLKFKTTEGEWLTDDELTIIETEEFLNTCSFNA